jgi:hypothetical protein
MLSKPVQDHLPRQCCSGNAGPLASAPGNPQIPKLTAEVPNGLAAAGKDECGLTVGQQTAKPLEFAVCVRASGQRFG